MTPSDDINPRRLVRPRLLIVDDLEDSRILMARPLRSRGYDVTLAASGFEALDLLERETFDAVVLDVVMPGMDGFQVLGAIREQHSAADLPVIMATVRDVAEDVVCALRQGANDYVVKPVDFDVLRARLDVQIRRKHAEACVRRAQPELEDLVEELRTARSDAEAAARMQANFIADLSHEIRTPLNGILGVTKALAAAAQDSWQSRMLATVNDSAVALERLVSDALDISRADAGALEIRRERFDLSAVVERCAGLFQALAVEKGLSFRLDIAAEARVAVIGDWLRLQQILNNLINNAVKFTSHGEVSCTVKVEADGRFRFDVRDTGVGFDEAIAAQLFERFRQADHAVAARFGGAGLGLAISRRLAQLMGGDIVASSRPNEGALFTLRLPLPRAEADRAAWTSSPPPILAAHGGRPARILVAEDHPTNRLVVELTLRAWGVDLVLVENGEQAVQAACSQDFDCILMDMEMPVMDGLAAIHEIRRSEADKARPPVTILALSAHTSEDHRRRSLALGANGHLGKPIHPDALLKALGEALASERLAAVDAAADRTRVALFRT